MTLLFFFGPTYFIDTFILHAPYTVETSSTLHNIIAQLYKYIEWN